MIGVAGGSGSGKTTIVKRITQALGVESVSVIQHDAYYRDRSHLDPEARQDVNYDHPDALETDLLVRHLEDLRAGRAVDIPQYDFAHHVRSQVTLPIPPRPAIVVEGILIFVEAALRALMDIRVFVDTDPDLRVLRRIHRDMRERRRTLDSVVEQYLETVRPMHQEFVEPSKRWAHMIIPEGGRNDVGVDMLVTKIASIVDG